MMKSAQHILITVISSAFLASCAPEMPPPQITYYEAPRPTAQIATIKGTHEDPGSMIKDRFVIVSAIDGLPVRPRGESKDSIGPVAVTPGRHVVRLTYTHRGAFGNVDIPMDFKEGGTYEARQEYISAMWLANVRVKYWVEDLKTRQAVTSKFESGIQSEGGSTYVPIIIPR